MTYGLVLPFDTDDPEFARGVEIGRLWEQLASAPDSESLENELVHAANAEMLIRLGEAAGRRATAVDLDGHWLEVSFGPVEHVGAVGQ